MLMALRECGLKNDALLETFYDILIEGLQIHGAYAIYMFYDRYDIPAKASDKERLGESVTFDFFFYRPHLNFLPFAPRMLAI